MPHDVNDGGVECGQTTKLGGVGERVRSREFKVVDKK